MYQMAEELRRLQREMARGDEVQRELQAARQEEEKLRRREQAYSHLYQEENQDVARLEKASAMRLFYTAVGRLDKKLEKEEDEARQARRKVEECRREVENAQRHREALERDAAYIQTCEEDYRRLYSELLEQLKREQGPNGPVEKLEARLCEASSGMRELEEALAAGRQAVTDLENALASLDSAKDWGVMDLVLDGGFITNMVKYDKMDEAQAFAYQAQCSLTAFQKELSDLEISELLQVEISGFLKFADWFFDGLFADWAALSKIKESRENVRTVYDKVSVLMNQLEEEYHIAASEKQQAGMALDSAVLGSGA